MDETPREQQRDQFSPIDVRSFPIGRHPHLDLYHLVDGQHVLYCRGTAVFTRGVRRNLLQSGVKTLWIRTTDARAVTPSDLTRLLMLPDDQLAPSIKAALLYNSSLARVQSMFDAPDLSSSLAMARELIGVSLSQLIDNPRTFTAMVDLVHRDSSIYTHSMNASTYALAVGEALHLDRQDTLDLGTGALLHDVGKLQIPKSILRKPGRLTDEEWAVMRRHPELGLEVLGSEIHKSPIAVSAILQHHERMDGSGYPRGLSALLIPPAARVMSLVDVFDALTTDRPYRKAMKPFEALTLMRDDLVAQIDRGLFATFVRTLGRAPGQPSAQAKDPGASSASIGSAPNSCAASP